MLNIHLICALLIKKTRRTWKKWNSKRELQRWSLKKSEIISNRNNAIRIEELGLSENDVKIVKEKLEKTDQVLLANLDQDGFFLSYFGQIDGLPLVSQENFLPRKRFLIDLVAVDHLVGIRKNYRNNIISFLTELEALHFLRIAGCNVPAILDADFKDYSLTLSYIPGKILREELAIRGAILRDRDVEVNSQFIHLSKRARRRKKIFEGRKYLRDVVHEDFIEKLFDQIMKIHSAGFNINDLKYGNIIIEKKTGHPFLIDFESSENLTGLKPHWIRAIFDNDMEQFYTLFGTIAEIP